MTLAELREESKEKNFVTDISTLLQSYKQADLES